MSPSLKHCSAPGCRSLLPLGTTHCAQHRAADNQRRHAKQEAHGRNTAAWRRKRKQRLDLDGHACQRCGAAANTVHLDPAWKGDHEHAPIDAMTSMCTSCHGTIDAPRATRTIA